MKIYQIIAGLAVIASFAALPMLAKAQSLLGSTVSDGAVAKSTLVQLDLTDKRPSEKTKIHRYLFDAFGPYPIVGSAITAGIARFMILPRSGGKAQWVIAGDSYPTGV